MSDFRSGLSAIAASFAELGFTLDQVNPIHDELAIQFLTTVVGAGLWQSNLLRFGLQFEWIDGISPPAYREENNKSALTNMDKLRDTVNTWETQGFVERLSSPPHCCNPMTVAVQYNASTDTTKYRPCIDLSHMSINTLPL